MSKKVTLSVTPKQRDTILAALRFWQDGLAARTKTRFGQEYAEIATNGRKHGFATPKEIAALCEEINHA